MRIPVGVVVERVKADSPWIDYLWRPTGVLPGQPDTAPWTKLAQDGDRTTFYAGPATIELYRTETTNYRDNLATAAPSLWVVLYPTNAEPPYEIYLVTADPNVADSNSEAILKTISHQNAPNHNGGQLQFSPDGFLYAAIGDGGSGFDPFNNGQDTGNLLGKMLRVDVNNPPDYIPASNPFAGAGLPLDEIWAIGLRNPWRFSFDRATGDLYIADVGEHSREEIDYQPAGSFGGENYGWRCMEGTNECILRPALVQVEALPARAG